MFTHIYCIYSRDQKEIEHFIPGSLGEKTELSPRTRFQIKLSHGIRSSQEKDYSTYNAFVHRYLLVYDVN